jgi:hypothetical protein
MKLLAIALTVLIALAAAPFDGVPHRVFGILALLAAVALTVWLHFPAPARPAAPTPASPTPAAPKGSAEAEVIAFLALLQRKGRFIDFLMDDIAPHDDATVGAVARLVHQGCRDVVRDHLDVRPLESAAEGGTITVPAGYRATDYELSGKLGGPAPFTGTLEHRGWKVASIRLPQVTAPADGSLPPLAPAQVTVR